MDHLDWKQIAAWLGWVVAILMSVVTGLLGFLGRDVLKRVKHLEDTKVGKDDLAKLEKSMSEQRRSMHAENKERLESIGEGVTRTHERIDQLYRDLMGRD